MNGVIDGGFVELLGSETQFGFAGLNITGGDGAAHFSDLRSDARSDGSITRSIGDVLSEPFFSGFGVGHFFGDQFWSCPSLSLRASVGFSIVKS